MMKSPIAFAAALSVAVSLAALAAPALAQAPAAANPTDEYRLPDFGGWGLIPKCGEADSMKGFPRR